jgi:hypothetical protein
MSLSRYGASTSSHDLREVQGCRTQALHKTPNHSVPALVSCLNKRDRPTNDVSRRALDLACDFHG